MQQRDSSPSQSYFWPTVLAVGLHVIIFGMLFVSFSMTPELPPSKPIVQATLYQLKSQSQATSQTNQKIAGEAKKTAAKQYEAEQMEKQAAAKAAEQKKAEEARKAEAAKAAADKAAAAKKAEEAKKVEQQKQAEIAKKKAAEELAKKKAAEEAKKKAAEEAKKKAAEEAKKKAAAEAAKKNAAEEAKKKAAAEAARKAAEDKKAQAQALAELLSDTTERQQAMADTHGDQVAGNFDDLIRLRAAEGWTRPPSARNNMTVQLQVNMLPDGTITNVSVSRSSGDVPFDNSAVAAVKNIGRLTEMQGLSPQEFQPYRSFKMTFTPEDLAL